MNNPQDTDTAIEQVASEAPEIADNDLFDEALDRPRGWGEAALSFMQCVSPFPATQPER